MGTIFEILILAGKILYDKLVFIKSTITRPNESKLSRKNRCRKIVYLRKPVFNVINNFLYQFNINRGKFEYACLSFSKILLVVFGLIKIVS